MPGFVKLVGQQDEAQAYLIDGSAVYDFRFGRRGQTMVKRGDKFAYRFSNDYCQRAAQILRDAGSKPGANPLWISARAFDQVAQLMSGEPSIESLSNKPVEIDIAYKTAEGSDGKLHQVPPIRKVDQTYFIDIHVYFEGSWQNTTVSGRSANEAIAKLFLTGSPIYDKFVADLPVVDAPVEVAPAAVDISTAIPMTRKEYDSIPGGIAQRRYLTEPLFRRAVVLMEETEQRAKDAFARKQALEDERALVDAAKKRGR